MFSIKRLQDHRGACKVLLFSKTHNMVGEFVAPNEF